MEYTICIEEHISQNFTVEASTEEEALKIAKEKYHDGIFEIHSHNVTHKCMSIVEPSFAATDWEEF